MSSISFVLLFNHCCIPMIGISCCNGGDHAIRKGISYSIQVAIVIYVCFIVLSAYQNWSLILMRATLKHWERDVFSDHWSLFPEFQVGPRVFINLSHKNTHSCHTYEFWCICVPMHSLIFNPFNHSLFVKSDASHSTRSYSMHFCLLGLTPSLRTFYIHEMNWDTSWDCVLRTFIHQDVFSSTWCEDVTSSTNNEQGIHADVLQFDASVSSCSSIQMVLCLAQVKNFQNLLMHCHSQHFV